MKKYNSEIHIPTVSVLWIIFALLIATPFLTPNKISGIMLVPVILVVISALLIFWILLDTKYTIRKSFLFYQSGPLRGKIDIYKIHTVEYQKKWLVRSTVKPALGTRGLIIRYGKFDEIYISPKNKKEFLHDLLEINPQIEIID